MDYNNLILRTANKEPEEVRIARIILTDKSKKTKAKLISEELSKKYEEIKGKFKSFGDIWTEEEIAIVRMNFQYNVILVGKRVKVVDTNIIYQTAIELERTYHAIKMKVVELWSDNENLHRGKVMIAFRKTLEV